MESMAEQIKSIHDEHEEQFNIAVSAAFQRGFGRWFDDTWTSAKAQGARANPFISSMFVFLTTMLMKKFIAGLSASLTIEEKELAITTAVGHLRGYIDQIEASAIKDIHNPIPTPRCPKCFGPLPCEKHPVTSKGSQAAHQENENKQTIILPKKRIIQ